MDNKEPQIIIKNTQPYGVLSLVFGFIGIFILSFILSPLAVILGILAIANEDYTAGIIGIIFAALGILTSPILMALINMPTITYITNGVML
ncbi:MAG: hypothetical protein CMD88_05630 [Gammaproteobacteria bacterium]|nr:hypothetical protein [Gammaproteobacteria bacterium]MBH44919.1 hypothetical protein [Gammaproteobacteria bacterium]|tara:strand:- start:131532 stop:131804 length:273 start_codon:yes stop_codon:yes gene_type:complete